MTEQDTGRIKRGPGRPVTVGATVKATYLMDPARIEALARLCDKTQRTRNSLLREAVDDLLAKYGIAATEKEE